MAPLIGVVDTGPLYAAADMDDAQHDRCLETLGRPDLHLVIPALVVTEVTYFIGTRLGSKAEASFLASLAALDVEPPSRADWSRIAELVLKYHDFPLGGTDAATVVLAERLGASTLVTLDRRHFAAVRPRHCKAFTLLP